MQWKSRMIDSTAVPDRFIKVNGFTTIECFDGRKEPVNFEPVGNRGRSIIRDFHCTQENCSLSWILTSSSLWVPWRRETG